MTLDELEAWMKENNISGTKLGQMLTGKSTATTVYGWKKSGKVTGKYVKKLEQIMKSEMGPAQSANANYVAGNSSIVTAKKPRPQMTIHHDHFNFCPYCGHKL
jgi:hypothetical protein